MLSERQKKIYGKVMRLSEELNVKREMNSAYINKIVELLYRYDDNTLHIFFKEAPFQFKAMPGPSDAKDYIERRIKKPEVKAEAERIPGCAKCKHSGIIVMNDLEGHCCTCHCSCQLGLSYKRIKGVASVEQAIALGYILTSRELLIKRHDERLTKRS